MSTKRASPYWATLINASFGCLRQHQQRSACENKAFEIICYMEIIPFYAPNIRTTNYGCLLHVGDDVYRLWCVTEALCLEEECKVRRILCFFLDCNRSASVSDYVGAMRCGPSMRWNDGRARKIAHSSILTRTKAQTSPEGESQVASANGKLRRGNSAAKRPKPVFWDQPPGSARTMTTSSYHVAFCLESQAMIQSS